MGEIINKWELSDFLKMPRTMSCHRRKRCGLCGVRWQNLETENVNYITVVQGNTQKAKFVCDDCGEKHKDGKD